MSPIPTGLGAQSGMVDEVTYGTGVTVTRFFEFVSESLKMTIERMESQGLRASSRLLRSDRWASGRKSVEGDIEHELANKGFGIKLKHCLGGVSTSQPASVSDPTVFDHIFTPGDLPTSFTEQIGRPDRSGTVQPFTYEGCRVASWSLGAAIGEFGKLKLSIIGEDEKTGTALAVASYPAGQTLMTFVNGSLTVGGSASPVRSFSIGGNNGLAGDDYALGSALRRSPLEAALREYTGEVDADFVGLGDYNRFINGTEAALEFLFEGATISNAFKFQTKITANVRFDGDTPNVGGPAEIRLPLKFKCVGNTSASALTVLYRTTDSTP